LKLLSIDEVFKQLRYPLLDLSTINSQLPSMVLFVD